MTTIDETFSPGIALMYIDGKLKSILIKSDCDKIEWEAKRHEIPLYQNCNESDNEKEV